MTKAESMRRLREKRRVQGVCLSCGLVSVEGTGHARCGGVSRARCGGEGVETGCRERKLRGEGLRYAFSSWRSAKSWGR